MTPSITRRDLWWVALAGAQASGQSRSGAMLWEFVREYLRVLDERRSQRLAGAESEADFAELRKRVRTELRRMWGAFPPRSSLNPSHVGTLDAGDHRVERIVFESRPGFHVTANLYRPRETSGPLPAVIFPVGHSAEGKAGESYQRFCQLIARNGMAVLTWDAVGQGERGQFVVPGTGASRFRPGSAQHRVLGDRCYLLGGNLMEFRAWDATRALDYLESRPEFDRSRLGIAGQSGGGMVTLQFACFDDRIRAAFASCAVASFRAKTEALLIADPEQVLYGTLRAGIDHPELLAAFAPKPLMIGAAVRDYVPIAGVRRTHGELAAVYEKLGEPGNLQLAETDAGHGLNRELREAAVRFFARVLRAEARPAEEDPDAKVQTPGTLACTASGQVSADLGSRSVLELLRETADESTPEFPLPRGLSEFEVYQSRIAARVKEVTRVGSFKSEFGIDVPSRFLDAGVYSKGTAFVVADQGKDHPVVQRYLVDAILAASHSVYGLDLRGWGTSAIEIPSLEVPFAWDDFIAYRSLELGRPLFGQRLKDLLATAPMQTRRREWIVAGVGIGGLVVAHAAVLDPRVSAVISIQAPASLRSILDDPEATQPTSCILPGVLRSYDIRDIYASIAPRPLLIVNPQDARRRPLASEQASAAFKWAEDVYSAVDASPALRVECELGRSAVREVVQQWVAEVAS